MSPMECISGIVHISKSIDNVLGGLPDEEIFIPLSKIVFQDNFMLLNDHISIVTLYEVMNRTSLLDKKTVLAISVI